MFLKNRNISSKIKISKVTDYAALRSDMKCLFEPIYDILVFYCISEQHLKVFNKRVPLCCLASAFAAHIHKVVA